MAKKGSVQTNRKRVHMVRKYAARRSALRAQVRDMSLAPEERFQAALELAKLPRNGSPTRVRNRCELTGRARGYYRKFRLSRIALRELASVGQIPGMVKSSW